MNAVCEMTDVLDLACEVCPATFLKAKDHIDQIPAGDRLEIVVTGADQMRSMAINMKAEGHRIEAVRRDGERYVISVRKGE